VEAQLRKLPILNKDAFITSSTEIYVTDKALIQEIPEENQEYKKKF